MTTSTITLVRIATTFTTAAAAVVPNSFPNDSQVMVLDHKSLCTMLAQDPTLVGFIRPRCGHREEPPPVNAPLSQEL
ncbi:hypothetical protein BKA70DRAFT_1354245 [Coprinopsis sp. MPI-PUGE-AT-0042]|nr:hypothetical protein BKA70DRAFT_1354245 [Coprinopsis sp. MPI-PUGE-AT-0042]